jgi:hypothetical protein
LFVKHSPNLCCTTSEATESCWPFSAINHFPYKPNVENIFKKIICFLFGKLLSLKIFFNKKFYVKTKRT